MRFAKYFIFAVFILPLVDKALLGQQGRPMFMDRARTRYDYKVDPTLPWISEYRQPVIYQIWWQEIAACEGLPLDVRNVDHVQFFQVNAPDFIPKDMDAIVYAVTFGEQEQVYIANPYIWNRAIVEHEALHLIRKWAGDPYWYDHSPQFYGERCRVPSSGTPPPNQ